MRPPFAGSGARFTEQIALASCDHANPMTQSWFPVTIIAFAFIGSASAQLAADEGSWLYRNGWIYWLLLFAGAESAVVLASNSRALRGGSHALRAAAGALLLSSILVAGVLGLWSPYALGIASRSLDEFGEDSEMPWERLLAILLVTVAVLGVVLGGLTGLVFGRFRTRRLSG